MRWLHLYYTTTVFKSFLPSPIVVTKISVMSLCMNQLQLAKHMLGKLSVQCTVLHCSFITLAFANDRFFLLPFQVSPSFIAMLTGRVNLTSADRKYAYTLLRFPLLERGFKEAAFLKN